MDEFVCGTNMPLVRAQCRIDYLEKQLETYAKPVEMKREQKQIILTMKERGKSGFDVVTHIEFYAFNRDDLMRAWLNPNEVIKVVE